RHQHRVRELGHGRRALAPARRRPRDHAPPHGRPLARDSLGAPRARGRDELLSGPRLRPGAEHDVVRPAHLIIGTLDPYLPGRAPPIAREITSQSSGMNVAQAPGDMSRLRIILAMAMLAACDASPPPMDPPERRVGSPVSVMTTQDSS